MNTHKFTITIAAVAAAFAGYWFAREVPAPTADIVQDHSHHQNPMPKPKYLSYRDIKLGKKPMRPVFKMPDGKGKIRNIKEWHGKIILLNFWATWCPPCRKEMPAFIELQKKYAAQGFQVIGVAVDDKDKVNKFATKIGVNYPLLIGSLRAAELSRAYGNTGGQLPYTVFINRKGQLVAVKRGEISKQQTENIIKKLLKN